MKVRTLTLMILFLIIPLLASNAYADALGLAAPDAVLATTTVTDASGAGGATVITGDMGAVSCTGFVVGTGCTTGFGTVSGTTNLSNATYSAALADSNTAYTALANTPGATDLTGGTLGVGTDASLAPGVYSFSSTAALDGVLTLNGGGNPNALWIFQIGTGFTTASDSSIAVTGTGAGAGVYFEVGTQATLGTDTSLQGNILAGTAVVFDPGAQITCGRAFTDTAAGTSVTFAGASSTPLVNEVSNTCSASSSGFNGGTISGGSVIPTPEPGTLALLLSGLLPIGLLALRKVRSSPLTKCAEAV
jgi:type VI secretion system secreted protein VgrG